MRKSTLISVWVGSKRLAQFCAPTRPYRNLEEYKQNICAYGGHDAKYWIDFWPCLTCDGNGRIYDPNDPPCPIEGNKLRYRMNCPSCAGTGKGSRAPVQAAYNAEIEVWRVKKKQFDDRLECFTGAVSRLTDTEIDALTGWLGKYERAYAESQTKTITVKSRSPESVL